MRWSEVCCVRRHVSSLRFQVPGPMSQFPGPWFHVPRFQVPKPQVSGPRYSVYTYVCTAMTNTAKPSQTSPNLPTNSPKNSQAFFKPLHAPDLSVACSHHPPDISKPPQTCLNQVRKEEEKGDRREAKE